MTHAKQNSPTIPLNRKFKFFLLTESILYLLAICLHLFVFDASFATALFFLFLAGGLHYIVYKIYTRDNSTSSIPSALNDISNCNSNSHHRFLFPTILVLATCYIAVALLFYTAWVNGDEAACLGLSSLSFKDRVILGCSSYFRWVPRIGEQICVIGTMNLNRWQHWLFSPLFLMLIPIGFWRLFSTKNDAYQLTRFILFFLLVFFLQFVMDGQGTWYNYRNYFSFSTYIWPTATSVIMLSYLNPRIWQKNDFGFPMLKVFLLFLLGLYSGWGCECVTVILLPIILVWLLHRFLKKLPTPVTAMSTLIGFVWGAMLMFVSTAHLWRTIKVCKWNRSIKPEEMSPESIWDMVTNITPQIIAGLGGIDGIMLHGIPYHLHIFFLPLATEKFWNESSIAVCILLGLCAVSYFWRVIPAKKIGLTLILALVLSWTCACSYLAQTIPGPTSFVPPVYFIVAGCAYLFYHILKKNLVLGSLIVIGVASYAVWYVVPAAIEAWTYKSYEQKLYQEIIMQRNAGNQDIVLSHPYEKRPINKLGFIYPRNSFLHPSHNMSGACLYFGVKSISMPSSNEEYCSKN